MYEVELSKVEDTQEHPSRGAVVGVTSELPTKGRRFFMTATEVDTGEDCFYTFNSSVVEYVDNYAEGEYLMRTVSGNKYRVIVTKDSVRSKI